MTTGLVVIAVAALAAGFQSDAAQLAAPLAGPEMIGRIVAGNRFEPLAKDRPEVFADSRVQNSLIAALEIENALLVKNWNAAVAGQKPLLDEDFGEHYSRIIGWADRLRGESNLTGDRRTRLLRALVLGSYNGDSPFAKGLASEGEAIVPHVLEAVKSPIGPRQWNGYDLIALLFTRTEARALKRPLTANTTQVLRAAAREGLQDPAPDVRRTAVSAVVAAKDVDAIPILRYMAEKDSDAKGQWSVRARAAEGIKRLQEGR